MFKRLVWWGSGLVMGAAGSWWAKRKARAIVADTRQVLAANLSPRKLVKNAAGSLGSRVTAAVAVGKESKADSEAEITSRLNAIADNLSYDKPLAIAHKPAVERAGRR